MDSVHHIWCPLFSQEFQDLPDGAETTLTVIQTISVLLMAFLSLENTSQAGWFS
ncbi:hypothetical protein SNC38_04625 [Escherichia coli]|nr:hypothetical protein [Escherichia coli]MDZ9443731.1 hypothetical protein [Escherichia coli]